jgi:hypothetical protein
LSDISGLPGTGDGFGNRALVPVSQQSSDMEAVRIQSMDVLAEVVEAATDAVGNLGSVSLADIEKLIKNTTLTKKDITEAIRDAFTQPVLMVRDNTILVRAQVKANAVQEASKKSSVSSSDKETKPASNDWSWMDGDSKAKGGGGPLFHIYENYKKMVDLMDVATHRPLKLIDMGVDLLAKGADKLFGKAFKKGGKKESGGGFFGSGAGKSSDYEPDSSFSRGAPQTASVESDGFGSIFNAGPGFASDDYQTATVQGGVPFSFFGAAPEPFSAQPKDSWFSTQASAFGQPLLFPASDSEETEEDSGASFSGLFSGFGGSKGGSSDSVSTADTLEVDAMESDIQANKMLFKTFDEPEKSDFGKFLDFQISGGSGGQEKSKANGLLQSIFEGFLLAGLLFALPFIVSSVIPFIKGTLIPFIEGPFLTFVQVAGRVLGKIGEKIFPFILNVLTAMGRWLDANGERVWGVIEKTLTAIGGWLYGTAVSVWPYIEKAVVAVAGWVSGTAWPAIKDAATAIGGWLVSNGPGIWGAIAGAAKAIAGWVQTDGWPAFKDALGKFQVFISGTLWPFLKNIAGPTIGFQLVNVIGLVGDLFSLFSEGANPLEVIANSVTRVKNSLVMAALAAKATITGNPLLLQASSAAALFKTSSPENKDSEFVLDSKSNKLYAVSAADMALLTRQGMVQDSGSSFYKVLGPAISGGWERLAPSKQLITDFSSDPVDADEDVGDAIITSDGQVIHTDPEDNIYAFKGNVSISPANSGTDVSVNPANSVREFSGSPADRGNQQANVVNNVTNNYLSQSNFNLSDLFPGSEFDPVGV